MYVDVYVFIHLFIYRIMTTQQSPLRSLHILSPTLFCSSRHEGSPDRDSEGTIKPKKNEEAVKKLNLLLKQMAEVT
jgi:hypothetical protein